MIATLTLLGLNTVEELLRRQPTICSILGIKNGPFYLPPESATSFSGAVLEESPLAPYLTASLCHASTSHYVNNMVMLVAVAPQLEAHVGALGMSTLYFASGAAGWWLKRWRLRAVLGEEMYEAVGKFEEGVGASPSTYALAVAAALLLDPSQPVGPAACLLYGPASASVGSSWASTVIAVNVLPTLAKGPAAAAKALPLDVATCLCTAGVLSVAAAAAGNAGSAMSLPAPLHLLMPVTASAWLIAYHLKTCLNSAYYRLALGRTVQQSDHAAHFGGCCFALAALTLLQPITAKAAAEVHCRIPVAASMAYLAIRYHFDI